MDNDIPIVVFDFFRKDEILRVLRGESVGTRVHNGEVKHGKRG
jgi:uridylate kinase